MRAEEDDEVGSLQGQGEVVDGQGSYQSGHRAHANGSATTSWGGEGGGEGCCGKEGGGDQSLCWRRFPLPLTELQENALGELNALCRTKGLAHFFAAALKLPCTS